MKVPFATKYLYVFFRKSLTFLLLYDIIISVLIPYQELFGYYDKVTIRSIPQSSDDRFFSVVIFYIDFLLKSTYNNICSLIVLGMV